MGGRSRQIPCLPVFPLFLKEVLPIRGVHPQDPCLNSGTRPEATSDWTMVDLSQKSQSEHPSPKLVVVIGTNTPSLSRATTV